LSGEGEGLIEGKYFQTSRGAAPQNGSTIKVRIGAIIGSYQVAAKNILGA